MTDLLFTPDEYADFAHNQLMFEHAVRKTQLLNSEISHLQTLQVLISDDELQRQIASIKSKLWRYALSAMRLQRQYHFPAYIYMHIAGPPGYQDLPLYRLPPKQ